jgi:3-isopropylmalate/(R)-2-methylmalate dehydratase large subunit
VSQTPQTLFDKIWDAHVVAPGAGQPHRETGKAATRPTDKPEILYIDLHLIHEVTSPHAFAGLRARRLQVRRPHKTVATIDHIVPTRAVPIDDAQAAGLVAQLEQNCHAFGIRLYGLAHAQRGIVHVIGPELGLTQPGMTIVCGDSHTAAHGAFGALAFGIGTSEVEHVLATQCLLQRKPRTCEVRIEGQLPRGVSAKDIILALIAQIGIGGGTGSVFEYTGSTIRTLSMEERMTICNMSIEGGARAGMIAPDDTTFEYLAHREFAPQGAAWETALARWRRLPTDDGARFDKTITLRADTLEPMITFGTNPGMGIPISGRVPDPDSVDDASQKSALEKALAYMGLAPGKALLGHPVQVVFIGSCTNARLTDLRLAASILRDKRIAPNVRALVVPGSQEVKRQAEAEGLAEIFRAAGCEWRESGCSMCIAMNGDEVGAGQYCVSTSNRNFEGRQGQGARTFLASPLTAAASAIAGAVADARAFVH